MLFLGPVSGVGEEAVEEISLTVWGLSSLVGFTGS